MYEHASTEPLEVIAANECDSLTLSGRRFMACFNEIERLKAILERVAAACIIEDIELPIEKIRG